MQLDGKAAGITENPNVRLSNEEKLAYVQTPSPNAALQEAWAMPVARACEYGMNKKLWEDCDQRRLNGENTNGCAECANEGRHQTTVVFPEVYLRVRRAY